MITVTTLNRARCSLRPQAIASVEGGRATLVRLTSGVTLSVIESVEEVLRRLETSLAGSDRVGAR